MNGPFDTKRRNDVDVRRARNGLWIIGCANCWGIRATRTWVAAMAIANGHARECR